MDIVQNYNYPALVAENKNYVQKNVPRQHSFVLEEGPTKTCVWFIIPSFTVTLLKKCFMVNVVTGSDILVCCTCHSLYMFYSIQAGMLLPSLSLSHTAQ